MWNGPGKAYTSMSIGKSFSYMDFMMEPVKKRDEEMKKQGYSEFRKA